MNKLSNDVFNVVLTYFMHGDIIGSEERYRLTMTEDEWAMMATNRMELYDAEEFEEFRIETIECMQCEFSGSEITTEKANTVKQCITELEQASPDAIAELFMRITRWLLETDGLAYIPENEVNHPAGIKEDVRLLDWGGIRITEEALKHMLIDPVPSDPPPRLTDEQLESINEYIQENCPELGVAERPEPFVIE